MQSIFLFCQIGEEIHYNCLTPFFDPNFGADPPNATISIYEPGQPQNVLIVVKITSPVVEGQDLIYRYKVLEGKMPDRGGTTTLFIDWIAYRPPYTTVYRPVYIR